MRVTSLLLLSIVGLLLVSSTVDMHSGTGPESCCFTYYNHRVPFGRIRNYWYTDYRCEKPAVVLTTRNKHQLCLDPTVPWVMQLIQRLDNSTFEVRG